MKYRPPRNNAINPSGIANQRYRRQPLLPSVAATCAGSAVAPGSCAERGDEIAAGIEPTGDGFGLEPCGGGGFVVTELVAELVGEVAEVVTEVFAVVFAADWDEPLASRLAGPAPVVRFLPTGVVTVTARRELPAGINPRFVITATSIDAE